MAENYTIETDIIYEGNGAVKEFPITFSFSNENEVVVYLNGELIRKGYSIDGDSIVFNTAPAEGDEIALAKAVVDTPEEEENTSGESSESGSNTVYDQASREHIKINPVPTKVKYSGNGEVTEFPTGFAFFENDNIIVYLNEVIIDGGYSVTGVGETDGGSVIFEEAPKEGDKIVILRKVAIERVTDFQEGGAFRAKNINDELDRQTAFCQQIQEEIDRCVKVEVTDDQDPQELIDDVFEKLDIATEVGEQAIKTAQETQELVEGTKSLIQEETQKAIEQLDSSSEEFINKARIWAEGEQEEVKPLGGELSSMGAADLAYAIANAPEDTPIDASGLFAMNVVKGEKGDKGDKGEDGKDGKDGGGLEIGDVAFAVMGIDETKNLRRYLNGQVISQSQFVSFTNWVKERAKLYPNTVATEQNWQAEVTNSPYGICGKFVIDDEAGTIRLPKYPDWSIREVGQAAVCGNGMTLGLTNGTTQSGLVSIGIGGVNNSMNNLWASVGAEGTPVSTSSSGSPISNYFGNLGVITDPTKSGMIADLVNANTEDKLQGKWFIQVATGVEESVDVTREIELNNPFSLLDYKWSEYEITNASWLLSNGAFHSGTVYKSVYELLLKLHNGTETKEGVSVKLSTEVYEDTDFVINTTDTTFRLPIKVKLASGNAIVGNGMTLGLTNGTQLAGMFKGDVDISGISGVYGKNVGTPSSGTGLTSGKSIGVTTDPTKSGLVLADNDMYLYFYVGETIQDANVINASGVLSDVANLKSQVHLVESYNANNGISWYRVYSDGWVEQGGYATKNTTTTFLKPFANANYSITLSPILNSNGGTYGRSGISGKTATDFYNYSGASEVNGIDWCACGQGAE